MSFELYVVTQSLNDISFNGTDHVR